MPVVGDPVGSGPGLGTLDLLTLAEAKAALNIPEANTDFDDELAVVVTAVSRRIDDLCGPVVIRSITENVHDGGTEILFLEHLPVAAVVTVTEYSGTTPTELEAETHLSKPSNGYYLAGAGMLRRRSGGSNTTFASGTANVVVEYQAGRYLNTESVDAKFKEAASLYLRHVWTKSQGMAPSDESLPRFGVPNVVLDMLAAERRMPVLA